VDAQPLTSSCRPCSPNIKEGDLKKRVRTRKEVLRKSSARVAIWLALIVGERPIPMAGVGLRKLSSARLSELRTEADARRELDALPVANQFGPI